MLAWECKKIFIRQKAYLILLAVILLKICSVVISGYDSHYMIDENESDYLSYLQKYQGKITSQKEKAIEKEYDTVIRHADDNRIAAGKEKAFQVIYHQYLYQKEKGSGVILETRGWQTLLEHESIDYILLVGIIVFSVMLFAVEYDSDMSILHLTSQGRYRHTVTKLLTGTLAAALLSVLFQLVQYLYLLFSVGLPYGSTALNGLEFFDGTLWNCSLFETWLFLSVLRIFGTLFAALLSMLVIVLVRRTGIALIVSLLLWVLPDIFLKSSQVRYYFPVGLLKASGYFYPNCYTTDLDGQKECVFYAMSENKLALCLLVFGMFACVCISGVVVRSSGVSFHGIQKRICKTAVGTLLFSMVSLGVTGCARESQKQERITVSESSQNEYQLNTGDTISIDEDNSTVRYCTKKGKSYSITESFSLGDLLIQKIYVDDSYCYYLMESDTDSGVTIRRIDLNNFSDEYFFSDRKENIEDFYGLRSQEKESEEIFAEMKDTSCFFVSGDDIFILKDNALKKINRVTRWSEIIADDVEDEPLYYDGITLQYKNFSGEEVKVKV